MKKKEDNSFQLLFTALVLVVIAVGGTLAWFAHNSTSSVDQIGASITSPSDEDPFGGEEISEWNGSDYVTFAEGNGMYVPGMKKLFRVEVYNRVGDNVLFVLDGSTPPALGSAIKIKFFDTDPTASGTSGYWLNSNNTPTQTINSLAQQGTYGLTVTHPITVNGQYVWFCLYMDEGAGNQYQGETFEFAIGVN